MSSRYSPLSGSSPSVSPRRPSLPFRLSHSRRQSQLPDPNEMDAAFDGPGEDDHDQEHDHLLGRISQEDRVDHVPGDYDFDRDYFLPPPSSSPPPFEDYSASNPAPGNNNGITPTGPVSRPAHARHFLGGILPLALLPRQQAATAPAYGVGGGQSGVFANLSARPDGSVPASRRDGPEWAGEDEQKDAPPSYQTALRDAVPPYWDTTVVLPSSSSPFGPLSSSVNGDEILIDGMAAGNFFGFLWNLIVSISFQFVGFLLTYVLHTTHAAKYGSRAGLGLTLIQFGFNLRSRAIELLNDDTTDAIDPATGKTAADLEAEEALANWMGPNSPWPYTFNNPYDEPDHRPVTVHNVEEAEAWAHSYNKTLADMIGMPSAEDIGRANEWFSFMLMSVGWFLVLTSIGGWWRVKRFERKLQQAQRESEAAQAAARGESSDAHPSEPNEATPTRSEPGPLQVAYYTSAFSQALAGAREIQRGFFGMRGRPTGHTPLSQEDNGEHELLDAQGFGLGETMASEEPRRTRGLWGV